MNLDAKTLRTWGIVVGAAALATSLTIATMHGDPAPRAVDPPRLAGPLPPGPEAPAPSVEEPVFEPASANDGPPPAAPGDTPVGFLVRFQGTGPLGRAQTMAARDDAQARRAAAQAIARQASFRGLCFDRFTLGGAEMVLVTCSPVASARRAQVAAVWLARLRDMSAVAYADVNATAAADRTP